MSHTIKRFDVIWKLSRDSAVTFCRDAIEAVDADAARAVFETFHPGCYIVDVQERPVMP